MDASVALRGSLAGLAATGAMSLLELAARSRWGLDGLLEWQENQAISSRITGQPVEASVLAGLGFHFLHGLLAGIVFVLILPIFPPEVPLAILGPGYGVVLFSITLVIHKPITGRRASSGPVGSVALGVSLAGHVIYGAVLVLLVVWP